MPNAISNLASTATPRIKGQIARRAPVPSTVWFGFLCDLLHRSGPGRRQHPSLSLQMSDNVVHDFSQFCI